MLSSEKTWFSIKYVFACQFQANWARIFSPKDSGWFSIRDWCPRFCKLSAAAITSKTEYYRTEIRYFLIAKLNTTKQNWIISYRNAWKNDQNGCPGFFSDARPFLLQLLWRKKAIPCAGMVRENRKALNPPLNYLSHLPASYIGHEIRFPPIKWGL